MSVLEGKSGSSGLGYSELKDIECEKRYAYIQERVKQGLPPVTSEDEQEAFRCGSYLHACRAKWLVLLQRTDSETIKQCQQAGREDCIRQGYSMPELTTLEYELMFLNYAKYWEIRVQPKSYAVELFLECDFAASLSQFGDYMIINDKTGKVTNNTGDVPTPYLRTTRLDDLSYYPDVGGHCIGEFKTTYDLSGALKFYNANNPQILLQQLIYMKNTIHQTAHETYPDIKGTMVDIWDKARNRGTRQYLPLNTAVLAKFEVFLIDTLRNRKEIIAGVRTAHRNYFVCNTFNDAYKSQCKFKERCAADE